MSLFIILLICIQMKIECLYLFSYEINGTEINQTNLKLENSLDYDFTSTNNFSDHLLYDKNLFEGDILLDTSHQLVSKNAIRGTSYIWRNGKIPYRLSNEYTQENRSIIENAIKDIENQTCIRFIPKRWFDFSYLYIYPGKSCGSQVGRIGGKQLVSLGSGCIKSGIIQHELMHSIGFWHEQSRPDRDNYIRINWENIEKGLETNFLKVSWSVAQTLDEEYDYGSIMHYGEQAFANGFGPTFTPLKRVESGVEIGQRRAFSQIDVRKINKLYNCAESLKIVEETLISSLIDIINNLSDLILPLIGYIQLYTEEK